MNEIIYSIVYTSMDRVSDRLVSHLNHHPTYPSVETLKYCNSCFYLSKSDLACLEGTLLCTSFKALLKLNVVPLSQFWSPDNWKLNIPPDHGKEVSVEKDYDLFLSVYFTLQKRL